MNRVYLLALIVVLLSCKSDDGNNVIIVEGPTTAGLAYSISENNFSATYNTLRSSIQGNKEITIMAEVNHGANAFDVGITIRNSRLIFFGNPSVGTPLMQSNQLAGLDLPLKIMVYEDEDANVIAAFNTTSYLSSRFNINNSELQTINTALNNFTSSATNSSVSDNPSASISQGEGIITVVSQNDFNTTYNKLRNTISDNVDLSIVAEVDHQANAQAVSLELNPTKLIIFSNPVNSSPLIQNSETIAVDLPQKILVWEETDGTVNISYNNSNYLADRHDISENANLLTEMNSILANIAVDAAN